MQRDVFSETFSFTHILRAVGDDLVGRDDIHKWLQLLLSEPPEAPIAPGATVVDVAIDWDETEILSPTQVSQVNRDLRLKGSLF